MFQELIDFKNQLESIINGKKKVVNAIIKEGEKIQSYERMIDLINNQIYKTEPDLEENYNLLMEQFKEIIRDYKAKIKKSKERIAELSGLPAKQENTLHVYYESANFQIDWNVIHTMNLKQRIAFLSELLSIIESMPLIEADEVYGINKKFIPMYEIVLESKKNMASMLKKENHMTLKQVTQEKYLDMLLASSAEDIKVSTMEPSDIEKKL